MEFKENTNAENLVAEEEFTPEETRNQSRVYENDILKGMLEAADFKSTETQKIEIVRGDKVFFSFTIRPLSEDDFERCRKKHTKFVRNKQLGIMMPQETNTVKYKSALIYTATTEASRRETWDNRQLWDALTDKGIDILTGTDVIDAVLMSGEKAAIIDKIEELSGYQDDNLEEVVKN